MIRFLVEIKLHDIHVKLGRVPGGRILVCVCVLIIAFGHFLRKC